MSKREFQLALAGFVLLAAAAYLLLINLIILGCIVGVAGIACWVVTNLL